MRNRNRRGMLLLVVLALLAMFAMMAVAFVVMTGAERGNADKLRSIEVQSDPPQKLLNDAAKIVVTGSPITPIQASNQNYYAPSAIGPWSLLEKIYGFDTVGTLKNSCTLSFNNTSSVCNGQLIEFPLPLTNPGTDVYPQGTTVDPFHCVGCVLTMLDGPAAGLSTRIVGIDPQLNPQTRTYNVQIMAFEGGVQPVTTNAPIAHYIVNGFPYSGMGFGFSPTNGALYEVLQNQQTQQQYPLAYLPNVPPAYWNGTNGTVPGGVNTDYTAPDYQDPLVAWAVSDGSGGVIVPIPSLHRSDLVAFNAANNDPFPLRYHMFRPIGAGFRNPDHPNFTGSNPNFNPTWDGVTNAWDAIHNPNGYKWDVDNMGRGRPDSVWVDLGMPVRYMPDGKAYKPLFAILCLDMDGRLNLNAHGSLAQTNPNYYAPQNLGSYNASAGLNNGFNSSYQFDLGPVSAWGPVTSGTVSYAGGTLKPPVPLLRGQGTGPAEPNLLPLFRNPAAPTTFNWPNYQYQYLLSGFNGLMGRYGPGIGSALPGVSGGTAAGSLLTMNNNFPYNGVLGGNYWNWTISGTNDAYGAPPDPQATGAYGLDTAGRPLWISFGGRVANGPYDFDITRNAPHTVDTSTTNDAFGVAEMERILRWPDRDATTLPSRLANLTLNGGTSMLNGRCAEFTVESNNVPVSAAVLPWVLRQSLPNMRSVHPVDIIYAQIYKNYPGNLQLAQSAASQLLPWEVLQGLKMNINRPFGAGAFSLLGTGTLNRAYVPPATTWQKTLPDQPGMTGETVPQYVSAQLPGPPVTSAATAATTFNYSADAGTFSKVNGAAVNDSLAARQLYARHIYVLALSLADTTAVLRDLTTTNPSATGIEDVARFLAQWAVNVVAYRDHNNIMIPFFYDVYPFGNPNGSPPKQPGWAPDYSVQHTVWGCKRPELLITETLAFHDRRTEDRQDETFDKNKAAADHITWPRTKPGYTSNNPLWDKKQNDQDPSFNSRFRPQGSAFVELFNPWPLMAAQTPDLAPSQFSPPSAQGLRGVELTKTTGANGTGSPVWRLIVVDPTKTPQSAGQANADELPDPDNPIVKYRPSIERAVYFVPLTAQPTTESIQVAYYPSAANSRSVVVAPGGYAVVGSGDPNTQNRTYLGFANGQTSGNPTTTRMVTLNPADLTKDARVVKNTTSSAQTVNASPQQLQVLAIDQAQPNKNGANSPQRFSISEPAKGYTRYENAGPQQPTYNPATGQYSAVLDIPVDQQRELLGDEPGVWSTYLNVNGTFPAYRIIYLQRLADPTRPWVGENLTAGQSSPLSCNPYRTVDAMTVDLTCFNGLTAEKDPTTATGTYHFESHQRGELNWSPSATIKEMNLWKQEPVSKAPNHWTGGGAGPSSPTMNFGQVLNESLGYLNVPFGPPSPGGAAPGRVGLGDPQYPFPLLNWAYRPFNNVYELLLVPTVSSSRLLARNANNERAYYGYVDGFVRSATDAGGKYTPLAAYDGSSPSQVPYPHLLNFFESKQPAALGASAQFHRLLYYLGVPSRFANTQLQVQAYYAGLNSATSPRQQGPAHWFHTPFNRISRYREPGLINLNTVTSPDVLFGALNAYCSPVEWEWQLNPVFWDKFVRSRRGDGSTNLNPVTPQQLPQLPPAPTPAQLAQLYQQSLKNMLQINAAVPSRFMRPYRTPGGAFLVPPTPQRQSTQPARETDVTLLRGDPDSNPPYTSLPANTNLTERPLYEMDDYLMGTGTASTSQTPDQFPLACMDFNRGANFRYQLMQKLGSTASTHSNVFAIWITVGYFEVLPWGTIDAGHPDGWQLGQEVGADTGDVTRHRAFFIFDRSLPVGFIRGQDINSDKAFLLKRFIE